MTDPTSAARVGIVLHVNIALVRDRGKLIDRRKKSTRPIHGVAIAPTNRRRTTLRKLQQLGKVAVTNIGVYRMAR